ENLRLGTMAAPGPDAERRLEEALEYFPRLRERVAQKGRFLSGGEQQMLAIARGLVSHPRIMLVDEPTEGLAPLLVRRLTEILREINRRGTTILLVEQTLEVAIALSHRLYVMAQGRIQLDGAPEAIRRDPTVQLGAPREPARVVASGHPLADLGEGAGFMLRHSRLLPILITQFVFNTAFLVLQAVYVPYAIHHLALSATQVGVTLGTYGVGMVLGALLAGRAIGALPFGVVIAIGPVAGLAAALLTVVTIWAPSFGPAAASFFVM